MALIQKLRSRKQKPVNWLWTVYGVFAAFLILDGLFYLLSPYSGRISTLVCKPASTENTICTVTIYGIREIYRRSFAAEDFDEALVIHNYTGDSADTTYGITLLLTTTEKINFIHPYQERYVVEPKAQQINDLFVGDVPTPAMSFTFIGINPSLYLRGLLLVFGLVYMLYRNRAERPWLKFDPKSTTQRRSFWRFAFYWAKNNLLVRAFFYLAIMIIFGILRTRYTQVQSDMVAGCYYIPFTDQGYFEWTWGYLLCFYPLLAILVIKALTQRQMLSNVNIPVSVWWIVAPLAAGPLLMVIAPRLYCEDCLTLKYLMFGTIKTSDTLHMIGLAIYFLGLGLIQWLALRKKLPLSFGWIIMPLVNAMFFVLEKSIYRYIYIFYLSGPTLPEDLDRMRFIVVFLPVLMIVPAIIISELIPALYISWLVNRRNAP